MKVPNKEYIRNLRDICRAKGLCTYCYHEPIHRLVRIEYTKYFSKCKRCLERNRWFQAEYRDRLKEKQNARRTEKVQATRS